MNELSVLGNSATLLIFVQSDRKLAAEFLIKESSFIKHQPEEGALFYLLVLSALSSRVGEAYFICRFSVHFSHTFVFSQKLLFWSFLTSKYFFYLLVFSYDSFFVSHDLNDGTLCHPLI